jgi:DNA polymerase-1
VALYGGIEIPGHPCLENVRKLDLLPIPLIRRAHRIGIAIDPPYFKDLSLRFGTEILDLERDISSYIPVDRLREFSGVGAKEEDDDEDGRSALDSTTDSRSIPSPHSSSSFNANSPDQMAKLLYDMLGIGAGKKLKTTNTGRTSTGKKQLELIKLEHPVVPLVLRHRELSKLKLNYADKLPRLAVFHPHGSDCPVCGLRHPAPTWRVHCEMGTTRADTGRINHKNPNEGNIPTRTEDGQLIQGGHTATPGHKLVIADLSQIELRGLAHLSNCKSMISVYESGGDIHDDNARKVFKLAPNVKPDKIKHRMAAKRVGFGIQNGTTKKGLYMQLVMDYGANNLPIPDWLTEDWCQWFIDEFLRANPEVQEYFELQWYRARRYGMVWTSFGRIKLIPEVQSCHSWIRESGLRQAQNMPVTGLAADQLKLIMGKLDAILQKMWDQGVWVQPLLTVHDSVMTESEDKYAEEVLELTRDVMDQVMDDEQTGDRMFMAPIESDGLISERWTK